jgi:hypothetical protein
MPSTDPQTEAPKEEVKAEAPKEEVKAEAPKEEVKVEPVKTEEPKEKQDQTKEFFSKCLLQLTIKFGTII